VTVNVTRSLPNDLVPAGSHPVPFTVSDTTLVLGAGTSGGLFGGSLSDVSVGDVVAGGLVGDGGLTLSQVSAMPLRVLLDRPASTSASGHVLTPVAAASAKARVLKRAISLLGHKSTHKVRHQRKHKKSHVREHNKSHVAGHVRRA
jgi:hypothetical protein